MKRLSSRTIIFFTVFIDLLGFGVIIPILPALNHIFMPRQPGVGAAVLMTAFSALQMLFSPFWGRVSDRYGRRPILLLSLFGSTASYVIFMLAPSFAVLLASRVFAGLFGANITAAQAYIADVTTEKERTAGMGLIGMAFGLGFVFGPILGGAATRLGAWIHPGLMPNAAPGAIAAAICGANLLWAIVALPESLPSERRGRVRIRHFASTREAVATLFHPSLGPLIFLLFLVTFAFSNLEVSFSLYAVRVLHIGIEGVYRIFAFIGLVMAFAQGYLVRRLIRYVPESILMVAGAAVLALGLALVTARAGAVYVLLPMAIVAVGQGLCLPSILSLVSRGAGTQTQGNVLGTSQAAASLARIVGPACGGILFDWGPAWPFRAAAALMTLAVGWGIFSRRRLIAHAATPARPTHERKEELRTAG
ncbi:MAG: MFS transporter [bacterium]|nr:MFS transporter [bacterium]